MDQHVQGFLQFIAHAPSAFHAVDAICAQLRENGFTPLSEQQAWQLAPGGRYFVTRNRSSVVAFAVPQEPFTHF